VDGERFLVDVWDVVVVEEPAPVLGVVALELRRFPLIVRLVLYALLPAVVIKH